MDWAKIFVEGSWHIKVDSHRRDLQSKVQLERYASLKSAAETVEVWSNFWFSILVYTHKGEESHTEESWFLKDKKACLSSYYW